MPGHVHVFGTHAISACSDRADVLGEVSSEKCYPREGCSGYADLLGGVCPAVDRQQTRDVGRLLPQYAWGVISGAVGPKGPGYAGGVDRTRWRRPGRHRVDTVDGSDDC
jgi:hypothetical protein